MGKLVVEKAGVVERELELATSHLLIGRSADADVILEDPSVSRKHARLEPAGGGFRLVDLDSGNGIVHQGARVATLDVYPDCVVQIGDYSLRFELDADPRPKLVRIGGGPRLSFPLDEGETVVGRSTGSDLTLDDPLVSASHFKVVKKGSVFALVDLDSENGTYVNGTRTRHLELSPGDQIRVGGLTLYFAPDGVEPEPGSIQLIQVVQSPQPSSPAQAPPPAASSPSAAPPSGSASPPPVAAGAATDPKDATALAKKLAMGCGGALALFVLVVLVGLMLGSPGDRAEQEFQDIFQANLSAEERERITEYLTRAEEYEERGSYELALEQYRKVLVLDQTHQKSLAESARLEEVIVERNQAKAERDRQDRERMAEVAELTERADALLSESKYDEARAAIDEALELSPESEVLTAKKVDSYVSQGDYFRRRNTRRAQEAYREALALDPDNAGAKRGLGRITAARQQAQQQRSQVDELTEAGLAQMKNADYRAAYRSFSEVLRLEPNNSRAQEFRSQAAELLEQQVRPIYDEGVRLYNAGELAASMERFHTVLERQPDHADTKAFLAKAMSRVRTEAVDRYKRAYIYEGLGRFDEALTLYQETLSLLPDPSEEYHQKAQERIADLNRKMN